LPHNIIRPDSNNVMFYWDGAIGAPRLKILQDCVYSTRVFNRERPIYVISNSLKQTQFDPKFQIQVVPWDDSFFEGVPVEKNIIKIYRGADPRTFSDFFRLVLLYQFGGSYVDTDDLAIAPMSSIPNLVCRSYDPHTAFYNKILDSECLPGHLRDGDEFRKFDHIPIFPRNDCWQNFESQSTFIRQILTHPKFVEGSHPISILGGISFQSLSLDACRENLDGVGKIYNLGLTLAYLFEDFVAGCSSWDRGDHGGEMHSLYKSLPEIEEYPWGAYRTTYHVSEVFLLQLITKYQSLSHLWLHLKEGEPEWRLTPNSETQHKERYLLSTWIYANIKKRIAEYAC
jgi:hypothetical protein